MSGRSGGGKLVVMCDVDGVLADFVVGFTALGHRMMPDLVQPRSTLETKVWRAEKHDGKIWDKVVKSPTFWYDLPGMITDEEADALRELSDRSDLYFVTARVGTDAKRQTEAWIEEHVGVQRPTVVISALKGEMAAALRATHAIDDKAGNAVAISWMSRGTRSYLLDRLHNQFDHDVIGGSVTRVSSVAQFVEQIG